MSTEQIFDLCKLYTAQQPAKQVLHRLQLRYIIGFNVSHMYQMAVVK